MTAAPRAILLAHGFTIEPMVGLASALTERIVAGGVAVRGRAGAGGQKVAIGITGAQ